MSKKLSIRMYLRHQKKNAEGKVPIYVHVTIDGDDEDFSLSRRIAPSDWSQSKQMCVGKSKEALAINTKIAKIRGELIALFDRQPAHEVVKVRQLIKLYQGQDPNATTLQKRDSHYHQAVLALIDRYFILKTREKKALTATSRFSVSDNIQEETDALIQSICASNCLLNLKPFTNANKALGYAEIQSCLCSWLFHPRCSFSLNDGKMISCGTFGLIRHHP